MGIPFDQIVIQDINGISLRQAVLTHEVKRQSHLEVTMPFLDAALGPSAVDARTKELVILRTSAVMGCRYCIQTHTVVVNSAVTMRP